MALTLHLATISVSVVVLFIAWRMYRALRQRLADARRLRAVLHHDDT